MHHIAFISPLGGTGQTTLVANLATALARRGVSCLALDLCAQNALGLHLGMAAPATAGWVSAVASGNWMGLAGYENTDAVAYLPYGEASLEETDAMDRQLTQPAWLHEQLQNLQLDKTVVLMDTPSWPSTLARQALRVAHLVVVCLPASTRSCKAQPLVRHLLSQTTAAQAVVITDFDPRRKLQLQSLEWLREQWADILIPYVIHRDESVPAALNQMSCVCAQTPTAQSAHDMQGIASWIAKRCGVEAGGL